MEVGPHGVVLECILKLNGEDFEIPKVEILKKWYKGTSPLIIDLEAGI